MIKDTLDSLSFSKNLLGIAALFLVSMLFLFGIYLLDPLIDSMELVQGLKEKIIWPAKNHFYWFLFHPILIFAMLLTLLLEAFFPVDRNQKIFSVCFFQDFIWALVTLVLEVLIISYYVSFLKNIYQSHLSFLTVSAIGDMPYVIRFIWGIVFADLLGWIHHFVRHKVSIFWEFHAVHHSQQNLNIFTDLRYHVFEYIISSTIKTFPFLIFGFGVPSIALYHLIHRSWTRFTHANVKLNMGFLRYILVTPQSHRVHHSCLKDHYDQNFGIVFSVWDRLFGTQCRDFTIYPKTGIPDESFPVEKSCNILSLLWSPIAQHVYPLKRLLIHFHNKR